MPMSHACRVRQTPSQWPALVVRRVRVSPLPPRPPVRSVKSTRSRSPRRCCHGEPSARGVGGGGAGGAGGSVTWLLLSRVPVPLRETRPLDAPGSPRPGAAPRRAAVLAEAARLRAHLPRPAGDSGGPGRVAGGRASPAAPRERGSPPPHATESDRWHCAGRA